MKAQLKGTQHAARLTTEGAEATNAPACRITPQSVATETLRLMLSGNRELAAHHLRHSLKQMPALVRDSDAGFRLTRALNWLEHGYPQQAAEVLDGPGRDATANLVALAERLRGLGVRSQWMHGGGVTTGTSSSAKTGLAGG